MLSLGLSNVISLTYMQQAVPGIMLGKTSAFSTAAATAAIPPGQFLFGQILEAGVSVPVLFLFVSAASLGTAFFVKAAVRSYFQPSKLITWVRFPSPAFILL